MSSRLPSLPLLVGFAVCVIAACPTGARAEDEAALIVVRLGNTAPWQSASGASLDSGTLPSDSARLLGVAGTPWAATLPGWLRWALEPQGPSALGTATSGATAPGYRGLSWSVPLTSFVLHQDDALSFGFSLGQSVTGLSADSDGRDRRIFPLSPLLRFGAALGYQVTPRLGLYVLFDHQSSSGPLREDESQNDLGIRVGLRF